jgi:chorismate--pyruvate lyase
MSGLGLRRWLRRTGSLSAQLQSLGSRFEVQRMSQAVARLLPGEARSLGMPPGTRCLVREVVLRVDGEPLVFARSVAPSKSVRGPWRSLVALGSRPLAQLLFNTPRVTRGPLMVLRAPAHGKWQRAIERGWQRAGGQRWPATTARGRYSVFRKNGAPLRVTEFFVPGLPAPQTMRSLKRGKPSTSASSRSPATTAATPSGVPL